MTPVYDAIGFEKIMVGGTTRPWLVNVLVGHQPVPYVVKLYTEKYNEENNSVLKDLICSFLADQFEIVTPEVALINFSREFVETLTSELRQELSSKDARLKFGTRLIQSGYENYSRQLGDAYLKDYQLGKIYAFDNMVLNVDRKLTKPNLFFKNKDVVVLDHEHTFSVVSGAKNALDGMRQWPEFYSRHIFFDRLHKMDTVEKRDIFGSFFGYFEHNLINLNGLESVYNELAEAGHPVNQYFDIRDYLSHVSRNIGVFENLLKEQIR